jgi:transcriptional regulator with XRE-family HTH domain/KaiC/GvpD/RAD55 family RecA-like ATPase
MSIKQDTIPVTTGIDYLDRLLGGLRIGDNVVWYDDAGSLAAAFYLNFIMASQARKKPLIYVSFDRSPKNLLDKLGSLGDSAHLTILDCFTFGKGAGSDVFLKFYHDKSAERACRILRVADPRNDHQVMEAVYGAHGELEGDVRFVFESLTGMQELWGGEEHIVNFYSHSCPRLYELNTVAYWIIEKQAHTQRLRARINQIAQVAIDLSVKRGKTSLTILKAEKRVLETINKPFLYWSKEREVTFDAEAHAAGRIDLGGRLKAVRTRQGLSQTDLAKLVGVTPSTISQVESNMIYPSLPALFKMAEVLSADVSAFFKDAPEVTRPSVFTADDAVAFKFQNLPKGSLSGMRLTGVDFEAKADPYLIEIPARTTLPFHFFIHKGEEFGYVLAGELQIKIGSSLKKLKAGDTVYLTTDIPAQWKNTGTDTVRMLWAKIR